MVIGRRVSKRKGQQLVALPPELRERLGVIPGQWLYFHLGRKGEAVLSTSPARAGGKPPTASLEADLERARARIDQLQRKLVAQPAALFTEWATQHAMRRLGVQLSGLPVVEAINDRLRRLEDQLGIRRGPWTYRAKRGPGRAVETQHLPAPPEAPTSTALALPSGDAATSETKPPALRAEK
jgi:hypothetical protein